MPLKEYYFFEIPIYRCSPEQFRDEQDSIKNSIIEKDKVEYYSNETANTLYRLKSYPFDYNETIGWIRLYYLGTQIRGDYYFEKSPTPPYSLKKRITRGIRKKRYEYSGKAFEINVKYEWTNTEIFNALLKKLKDTNKREQPFKKRFFDLSYLENIGHHVNWKNMFNKLND